MRLRDQRPTKGAPPVDVRTVAPLAPSILATIERALAEDRVLVLAYRGAKDAEARERRVCPLLLRLAKDQLYIHANEVESDAQRVFKVSRIERASLGEHFDRAARQPAPHDRAVVAWSGELVEVVVRINPEGARFVREFPLIGDQAVEEQADRSVIVRATVAGTEEVLRWTLSWGRKAEVLAPDTLRRRVLDELRVAQSTYDSPDRATSGIEVSHGSGDAGVSG